MTEQDIKDFKYPIEYLEETQILKQSVLDDLELVETNKSNSNNKSVYTYIISPSNSLGDTSLKQLTPYYTTNVSFLKETQTLLKTYNSNSNTSIDYDKVRNAWNEIKGETGFCEKYLYVDWDFAKFLNNNALFLQIMSVYNLASPVLSLFLPIFLLIVPFFIIKIKGLSLTLNEYVNILKIIISQHAIGRVFTEFSKVNQTQKIQLILSAAFYVFSIYQNILGCIRFYSNIKKIHDFIGLFKGYIHETRMRIQNICLYINDLSTYNEFKHNIDNMNSNLEKLSNKLDYISDFRFSLKKVTELGFILEQFYRFHCDIKYDHLFIQTYKFNGYIDCLEGLQKNITSGKLNMVKYVSDETNFKGVYYAPLINDDPIKNNCVLDKNMIITGPNASGKTTILKSNIINIILCQQFGVGCFESGELNPYHHIHCYLNIPDTSGRDSLFQAEARRCKEIIDIIDQHKEQRHFCIFDELYSGTNPEEAVSSATAFMKYLSDNPNVRCLLTTHFTKLCKKLKTHPKVINYHMKTNKIDNSDDFEHTYLLKKGISKVKGGLKVLKDMNYPESFF
jgi:MutS domain V